MYPHDAGEVDITQHGFVFWSSKLTLASPIEYFLEVRTLDLVRIHS
jgi:hypothetical protein